MQYRVSIPQDSSDAAHQVVRIDEHKMGAGPALHTPCGLVFSNYQWIAEPALHAMQQLTSFQPADQVLIVDPAWHGALEVLVISKAISIC